MTTKQRLRSSCAALAALGMVQSPVAMAQGATVETAPPSSPMVMQHAYNAGDEPHLSAAAKLALLRQRVKYVFVLFQENISFDQHFGTFPGANGLFSKPASATPGFVQPLVDTDGFVGTISPFLIPQTVVDVNGKTVPIYPADTDSVDHSHTGIDNSLDVDANNVARNDRYALNEEGLTTDASGAIVSRTTGKPTAPTLVQKQRGELVMGHLDCDTIPFLWQYADRFTLMDDFHQTIIGPSTPNALAMIAGQSGETQWALHPGTGSNNTASPTVKLSGGEPVVGDPGPFPGSKLDTNAVKPPYGLNDDDPAKPTLNQTYASLPLSFMGPAIDKIIQSDQNPALDLLDVQRDIREIASKNMNQVQWGWYQQGYNAEPTDSAASPTGSNYIVHHNGPQYFGYVASNTDQINNLHGLQDFFGDVSSQKLPAAGGVFYVRGGYGNNDKLSPLDPSPAVQKNFQGNDDHPGYSDAMISEALIADEVNAIANSPYWKDSAIIIAYDETDGLYDHALPHIRSKDPEGAPLAGGPRIPAIVVSPYAKAHAIDHAYAEHSSVIRFIDQLYGLVPLADLPDEARGRQLGQSEFGQADLGPADAKVKPMDNLFGAFDNNRLLGNVAPLPAAYAAIPAATVTSLPHYGGQGCTTLNIVPTDYQGGKLVDPAPADFNPRPGTSPGVPTSGTWTP